MAGNPMVGAEPAQAGARRARTGGFEYACGKYRPRLSVGRVDDDVFTRLRISKVHQADGRQLRLPWILQHDRNSVVPLYHRSSSVHGTCIPPRAC